MAQTDYESEVDFAEVADVDQAQAGVAPLWRTELVGTIRQLR
jgi:hypothetical protein